MAKVVLDSSAILALLNGEPGAAIVEATLSEALVSTVNYAEVFSKLIECGVAAADAQNALKFVEAGTIVFDIGLARETGVLRAETASRGLSLGDRACLALAREQGIPALTTDRIWKNAVADIDVQLIR